MLYQNIMQTGFYIFTSLVDSFEVAWQPLEIHFKVDAG